MAEHGTSTTYNTGCRCDDCRRNHNARMSAYREQLRLRPRDQVPHGTRGGYVNWGCRCRECTTAQTIGCRDSTRRHNARKRAKRLAS